MLALTVYRKSACPHAPASQSIAFLIIFDSSPPAIVLEEGDGVFELAIAHQMDVEVGALD